MKGQSQVQSAQSQEIPGTFVVPSLFHGKLLSGFAALSFTVNVLPLTTKQNHLRIPAYTRGPLVLTTKIMLDARSRDLRVRLPPVCATKYGSRSRKHVFHRIDRFQPTPDIGSIVHRRVSWSGALAQEKHLAERRASGSISQSFPFS